MFFSWVNKWVVIPQGVPLYLLSQSGVLPHRANILPTAQVIALKSPLFLAIFIQSINIY